MAAGVSDQIVCIVGGGHVGLVVAACLAAEGRTVRILDTDAERVAAISAGHCPIHEPGLGELLAGGVTAGLITATTDPALGLAGAGLAVLTVGTPTRAEGGADLTQARAALLDVVAHAERGAVVVLRSTVPPGSTRSLQRMCQRDGHTFPLVASPEFLRESTAIADYRHPPRVVIGGDDAEACRQVAAVLVPSGTPVLITDATSAEMIKYGSNAFLATKISFINEMARLCEVAGANVEAVADGIGADPRIGRQFLDAGLGFGGSCFPKDVRALEALAGQLGHSFWLLKAAIEVNQQQLNRFVQRISAAFDDRLDGVSVGVLGLAYKPGTDDVRQAPAIELIRRLCENGAAVTATDPVAIEAARASIPDATLVADPYECAHGADALVVVTEWPDYVDLEWSRVAQAVRRRLVFDGRNCLDGERLSALGFDYHSVGRPSLAGQLVGGAPEAPAG